MLIIESALSVDRLQFLRSTKSEDNTPSTSSGGRLMRLFSRDSTDDIPTSIPAPLVPPKQQVCKYLHS